MLGLQLEKRNKKYNRGRKQTENTVSKILLYTNIKSQNNNLEPNFGKEGVQEKVFPIKKTFSFYFYSKISF